MIYDVAVIGLGPAGLASALQLSRYRANIIALEKRSVGGLLINANLVENYPGFPNGINGEKLVTLMEKHLRNTGVEPHYENVESIDLADELFTIKTNKTTYYSKFCIVATGTIPYKAKEIEIEENALDHIYYEVSEIPNTNQKKIAIIGSGDAAFDYALKLSEKNNIEILIRSDHVKCLPLLFDRAVNNDNIIICNNINLTYIKYENNKLFLNCRSLECEFQKMADIVIFAIGRYPAKICYGSRLEKEYKKLINNNLLFEIGDLKNGIFRQSAISCGDGLKTAMMIYSIMKGKKWR